MRLAIIAGEASGDGLAADLMAGVDADFEGIGGRLMQKQGLRSLFPMEELSVMGFAEVLPKARHLLKRVREAADLVIEGGFDALITVDSPDFSHRVAKKVKAAKPNMPVIHYVAPSVWAWRPGRAKKMAHVVDHVLCLLPFEPPYMEAAGMSADFVGHPVSRQLPPKSLKTWKKNHAGVIGLFPGSRRSEIENHIGVYKSFLERLGGAPVMIPTLDHIYDKVADSLQGIDNLEIFSPSFGSAINYEEQKQNLIFGADLAVVTSGTVSFEISWADTNCIVGYQTNALNRFMFKRMVKVNYASLTNILLDEMAIPEFIFENFTADHLFDAVQSMRENPEMRTAQREDYARMRMMMIPDLDAATSVRNFLTRQ